MRQEDEASRFMEGEVMHCALLRVCLAILIAVGAGIASAHVPYLETRDFAPLAPFISADAGVLGL